ncbi:MAG: hypothetical protein EXR99_12105 [Gemmataceae bacterium]|nr:hypothetical protein [Gemmataceae bacterium]
MIRVLVLCLVGMQASTEETVAIPPLTPVPEGFHAMLEARLAGENPTTLDLWLRLQGPGLKPGITLEIANPNPALWKFTTNPGEEIRRDQGLVKSHRHYRLVFLKPESAQTPALRALLKTESGATLPLLWRNWLAPDTISLPLLDYPSQNTPNPWVIPGAGFWILILLAASCVLIIRNPGGDRRKQQAWHRKLHSSIEELKKSPWPERGRLGKEVSLLVRDQLEKEVGCNLSALSSEEIRGKIQVTSSTAKKESLLAILEWSEKAQFMGEEIALDPAPEFKSILK